MVYYVYVTPIAKDLAAKKRLSALLRFKMKQEYSDFCGFVRAIMLLAIVGSNSILLHVSWDHIWELPGNYPVFAVSMVIYHYVERIWRILVTTDFSYNIYDHENYHPGETVNVHIQ